MSDGLVVRSRGLVQVDDVTAGVLAAIRVAGGRPMLVGGCVRDAFLSPGGRAKDIDVEVYGVADLGVLAGALPSGGRVTEAGKSFGVLKIHAGETEVDVALPRRDSKTGAGHRGFDVVTDGSLDFRTASGRRDFTINSVMYDPQTGDVIDHWGGLADLRARVLRHTTGAFSEDPLRVLRGVQFAARFGFRLAPETAALCRQLTGVFGELPAERVWGEVEKFATRGRFITAGLAALAESGWECHFPQVAALHGVPQDPCWHPEGDVHVHTGLAGDQAARLADQAGLTGADRFVAVMAAVCHDFGKPEHTFWMADGWHSNGHAGGGVQPARQFLHAAGAPRHLVTRILPLVRDHMTPLTAQPNQRNVRRLARRLVPASMAELALVSAADCKGRGDPDAASPADAWLEVAAGLRVEAKPATGLLTGRHLIAHGLTPGPVFKDILAGALAAQDAGEFTDEAGAVEWLRTSAATTVTT